MASRASLRFSAFCCLFMFFFGEGVDGNERYAQVHLEDLMPSATCSQLRQTDAQARSPSSLTIVNRHGPCSRKSFTKQNHLDALARDALRVASIQATVAGTSFENDTLIHGSQVSIPARSGTNIGAGDFVIRVGFGTPTRTQTVIFDTGSNVNWIQCKPCVGTCYTQVEPLFDPALSSTYRNVSCTAPACVGLSSRGCSGTTCLYGVSYGDGSSTTGFLATDTFTLTPANVFQNFTFGCGQENLGLFQGAAGLVGLGRNSYSLNSQVAARLGNLFSYCLPSTSSSIGYLNIGNPLRIPAGYTPMLTDSRAPSLYFIDLIGITVGATRLALSPTVFQSVGTIIDSGTVITRLPPTAYTALRTAFRAAMTKYTTAAATSLLDTCYEFRGRIIVTYPVIKLHYTGLDVTIPATGVFYVISSSQVCLAFAGNSDATQVGIIGNTQQKTFEVTHDNVAKRIGFSARACR